MTPLRPAVEMSDALGCDRYAAVRVPVPPSDCLSQLDFGHFCSLNKQQQTAYAEEKIEFIPLSFWYDAPLTSQDRDRRHDPWLVCGSPTYSPARWSSWISPA